MTSIELDNQLGVALLSVLGTLAARKLGVPERLQSLMPTLLCVVVFWLFVDLPDARTTLVHGLVSGLVASGLLYIYLGLTRRS